MVWFLTLWLLRKIGLDLSGNLGDFATFSYCSKNTTRLIYQTPIQISQWWPPLQLYSFEKYFDSFLWLNVKAAVTNLQCQLCLKKNVNRYMLLLLPSLFSHVQLCDPIDCSPPGSSVLEILQARILEWVAMPLFRRSGCKEWTHIFYVSCIGRQVLYHSHHLRSP